MRNLVEIQNCPGVKHSLMLFHVYPLICLGQCFLSTQSDRLSVWRQLFRGPKVRTSICATAIYKQSPLFKISKKCQNSFRAWLRVLVTGFACLKGPFSGCDVRCFNEYSNADKLGKLKHTTLNSVAKCI